MSSNQENESNPWICLDDGTGRNLYYHNVVDGSRSRHVPQNFTVQKFSNGMPKYYFRGACTRCKKKEFPTVLSMKNRTVIFSFNICQSCIFETTYGITTLKGNGDAIWEVHKNTPKNMYIDLKSCALNKNYSAHLTARAVQARFELLIDSKLKRDLDRWSVIRDLAQQYGVISGKYVSWGLGKCYDEYFGDVNEKNQPHGLGMKLYADKSVYAGEWKDGMRHSSTNGSWVRSDGYDYEGTWVLDQKHGSGILKYPNGVVYKGEFARDLEHGRGELFYPDGSHFEGRFRFGRRDGPGTLTKVDGTSQKDLFRDYVSVFDEKPLLRIVSEHVEVNADVETFQPEPLFAIANKALSYAIRTAKIHVSPYHLRETLPDHLKPILMVYFLGARNPVPTKAFIASVQDIAFRNLEEISIGNQPLSVADAETIVFIQAYNQKLSTLKLTSSKLEAQSVSLICQQIARKRWQNLKTLDLSFNAFDVSSIREILLTASTSGTIRTLRLSGCRIRANGAFAIAKVLESDTSIIELDLSFNTIQAAGAESLAEAIVKNSTLMSLNIRQNDIGVVGGNAIAEALRYNKSLKSLCVVDNKIGNDNAGLISARLECSVRDIIKNVRSDEVTMPKRLHYLMNTEEA